MTTHAFGLGLTQTRNAGRVDFKLKSKAATWRSNKPRVPERIPPPNQWSQSPGLTTSAAEEKQRSSFFSVPLLPVLVNSDRQFSLALIFYTPGTTAMGSESGGDVPSHVRFTVGSFAPFAFLSSDRTDFPIRLELFFLALRVSAYCVFYISAHSFSPLPRLSFVLCVSFFLSPSFFGRFLCAVLVFCLFVAIISQVSSARQKECLCFFHRGRGRKFPNFQI